MIRLELPFPVPLSACFNDIPWRSPMGKWTTRKVPSKRYVAWQVDAQRRIALQVRHNDPEASSFVMPGQVRIVIRLVPPTRAERDADNCGKSILDSLVKAKIIENDSNRYVKRLTFAWEDDGLPCVVIVKPFVKGGAE